MSMWYILHLDHLFLDLTEMASALDELGVDVELAHIVDAKLHQRFIHTMGSHDGNS